ncbi:DUF5606 domain-containing protein [Pedobacter glucosidilyticus]|uniref:DUF5606 family protein n=1 Tax=Pedobacter glucosidilyticus TaxID=1122941 RepID=UPI0003F6AB65|nr:DUF5606 domain-containing protein [Pedobacter glucosidilyticus]
MNLTGLVAVSGKPGLYKLIGQNKSGFILESLDAQKSKLVVNMSTAKLASLEDITIYGDDEDLRLKDVFEAMKAFKGVVPEAKADGKDLRKFFFEVAPNHDETRVYASDIKKIVSWYHILKDLPIFSEEEQVATETQEIEAVTEEKPKAAKVKEAKPKAEKTTKAPAKKATKKEA